MKFNKIVSFSLKEAFVKEVEEMIFSGKLAIGARLPPERVMAEQMHVSQSVINAGVNELAGKGLLEIVPRKGTFVADYQSHGRLELFDALCDYNGEHFDPTMLTSLLEVRRCLEVDYVSLAARNRTEDDLRQMKDILEGLYAASEVDVLSRETFRLMHTMAKASGNTVHLLLLNSMEDMCISLYAAMFRKCEAKKRIALMDELVTAIEHKQPEQAAECVARSIAWGHTVLSNSYRPGDWVLPQGLSRPAKMETLGYRAGTFEREQTPLN